MNSFSILGGYDPYAELLRKEAGTGVGRHGSTCGIVKLLISHRIGEKERAVRAIGYPVGTDITAACWNLIEFPGKCLQFAIPSEAIQGHGAIMPSIHQTIIVFGSCNAGYRVDIHTGLIFLG